MGGAIIVATCIGGAILLLVTLGLIIIGIIRAAKTGGIGKEKDAHAQETKMIQDIFNGLSKMEDRVEALETILIERRKEGL